MTSHSHQKLSVSFKMDSTPHRLTFVVKLVSIATPNSGQKNELPCLRTKNCGRESSNKPSTEWMVFWQVCVWSNVLSNMVSPIKAISARDSSNWTVDTNSTFTATEKSTDWYPIELRTPILFYSCAALEGFETIAVLSSPNLSSPTRAVVCMSLRGMRTGFTLCAHRWAFASWLRYLSTSWTR